MQVFETEWELLQNTADTRFGGNVADMSDALQRLEERIMGRDSHFYRKVGNNCIVWSYCSETIRVCEENPDKLQGVFVADYGPLIKPGAVVIGSMFSGSCEVISNSKIRNSNLTYTGYIAESTITESNVSFGPISRSNIHRSYIHGVITGSDLTECMAVVGHISRETRSNMLLDNDSSKDRVDTTGAVSKALGSRGIVLAPGWQPLD